MEDTLSPRSEKAKEYGKIKHSQNVTRASTKVCATNDNKDSGDNNKSDDVFCYDDCKHVGAWKQKMMITSMIMHEMDSL